VRALLLAAGHGLRLRPLTNTIPKCLVPIGGEPLLETWLRRLDRAGIEKFLINTHYLAGAVEQHVKNSSFGKKIAIAYEGTLLGTAGTLINNLGFFEGRDGMLVHADNWCLADFDQFIKAHHARPDDCVVTMMAFRTSTPESCGILEIDDRNVVVGFHEKVTTPPGNLANGAVYILSAEFQEELRRKYSDAVDFSTEILPNFLGRIFSVEVSEPFIDIGTPTSYAAACKIAKTMGDYW
jgi:mannose-1-phosphate guanylyltransferase